MLGTRFVVQSPFQTMMAAEFRDQFDLDSNNCELVVLLPGELEAVRQITAVVDADGWTKTRWSPARTRTRLAQARFAKHVAAEPCVRLVVGDIRTTLLNHVAAHHSDVWLLDDGLGVEIVRQHRTTVGAAPWRSTWSDLASRTLDLSLREPPSLTFFSMFDMKVPPPDHLVRNRLERLHAASIRGEVDADHHLVLGSPWASLGMVDPATYADAAAHVLSSAGSTASYLPHRREDPDLVAHILARTGAHRSDLEGPVERSLTAATSLPGHISSFFSTASCTLWTVLGDRVDFTNYDLAVGSTTLVNPSVKRLVTSHSGGAIRDLTLRAGELATV